MAVHHGSMHWKGVLWWVNWSFRFHVGETMEWGWAPHRRPFSHPKHGPNAIWQMSLCEKGNIWVDAFSSYQTRMVREMVRYVDSIVGTFNFAYNYDGWIILKMCNPISNCKLHTCMFHVKFHTWSLRCKFYKSPN